MARAFAGLHHRQTHCLIKNLKTSQSEKISRGRALEDMKSRGTKSSMNERLFASCAIGKKREIDT